VCVCVCVCAEPASTPVKATVGAAAEPDAFLAQLMRSAAGVGEGAGAEVLTAADLEVGSPITQRNSHCHVERRPVSHTKLEKSLGRHHPSAPASEVMRCLAWSKALRWHVRQCPPVPCVAVPAAADSRLESCVARADGRRPRARRRYEAAQPRERARARSRTERRRARGQ
jgi:hypothetical protein